MADERSVRLDGAAQMTRSSSKVKRQKRKLDGTLKGMAHLNPILDTWTYEVEFPDGQIAEYSANIIVENMYAQCDTEGNQYLLLKEIVNWKKDDSATSPADMYATCGVHKHFCKTRIGLAVLHQRPMPPETYAVTNPRAHLDIMACYFHLHHDALDFPVLILLHSTFANRG